MLKKVRGLFGVIAQHVAQATGSVWAFSLAVLIIITWALLGPSTHYSDTWQLVINTGTTIVTFLMVFVIQHAQNKDTRAIHLKLDELIAAMVGASNDLIDLEDLSDEQIEKLTQRYRQLATEASKRPRGACITDAERDDDQPASDAGAAEQRPAKRGRDAGDELGDRQVARVDQAADVAIQAVGRSSRKHAQRASRRPGKSRRHAVPS